MKNITKISIITLLTLFISNCGKQTEYYENGQMEMEENYKDGVKDGKWTFYYENGQIREEGNYKDGNGDGKWT